MHISDDYGKNDEYKDTRTHFYKEEKALLSSNNSIELGSAYFCA